MSHKTQSIYLFVLKSVVVLNYLPLERFKCVFLTGNGISHPSSQPCEKEALVFNGTYAMAGMEDDPVSSGSLRVFTVYKSSSGNRCYITV